MAKTRAEIRADVENTTRETQIDSYINEWINVTLMEINDPAWAYELIGKQGFSHLWTFLRRKATVSISAETAQLPRDCDKVSLIRQTNSPTKLLYVPDEVFYRYVPYPTATGNPIYYRIWEEEGVSTRLSTDDMLKVVSSSTSDSTSFNVSVVGYDTSGILQSEVITLNGTTAVNGTVTFDAGKPLRISKSAATTGNITVSEKTAGTSLLVLGPEERTARFKVIEVYPIVTSATNLYVEYYTRLRMLANDADVADIDEKWMWVVRLGVCSKVYQYQNKESLFTTTQNMYASGVRSMVKADTQTPDYLEHLMGKRANRGGIVEFGDADSTYYGGRYGLNF